MIWLGGEGPNDIGGCARGAPYTDPHDPGVVHALLDLAVPGASSRVAGGTTWSKIPKYNVRRGDAETRNVLGLALLARDRGHRIVALVRDTDGDGDRATTVRAAARRAEEELGVAVVAGTPHRTIEAWVLAAAGERRTDDLSSDAAERRLAGRGIPPKDTASYVAVVRAATDLPDDAHDLIAWVQRARHVLNG